MQRAVTASRLDLAHPGTRRLFPPHAGGPTIPGRSALVHLSSRSVRLSTSRGVCDRSRRRTSGHPQSRQAPAPAAPGSGGPATGVVPDRRSTGRRTTIIRRAGARRPSAQSVDHTFARSISRSVTDAPVGERPSRLVRMVLWYQRAREGRPSPCRFTPSCSAYAIDALEQHGTSRGLLLTMRRLLRCRPFGPSGWDPVPEAPSRKRANAR